MLNAETEEKKTNTRSINRARSVLVPIIHLSFKYDFLSLDEKHIEKERGTSTGKNKKRRRVLNPTIQEVIVNSDTKH